MTESSLGIHNANLRDANPSDLPELTAILNQQIQETVNSFRLGPISGPASLQWWAAHQDPSFPILVAPAGGGNALAGRNDVSVAGWASLSPWSPYEAYGKTVEVSIWVRPDFHRQGLGRRLMEGLIERARNVGHRVLLSRVEANNRGSLRLHELLGFRTIGTMHQVGEKFSQRLDVVMLELLLDGEQ